MAKKKLYKTIIQVEVLSEEPLVFNELDDLHEKITDGHCSGRITQPRKSTILRGIAAAKATKAQGSGVEFFSMDDKGNEIED